MKNKQAAVLGLMKRRIIGGFTYSRQGLASCFKHEEAFRVEVILGAILIPFALILAGSAVELVLLLGSLILILIVELLNSAVEAVVDRVGEEHHELSGRAKDQGSAAVLLAMSLGLFTWLAIGFG